MAKDEVFMWSMLPKRIVVEIGATFESVNQRRDFVEVVYRVDGRDGQGPMTKVQIANEAVESLPSETNTKSIPEAIGVIFRDRIKDDLLGLADEACGEQSKGGSA